MGQIGPKWDKSGAFSDQISVHLAPPRQMHWNLIWKSPGLVPFGVQSDPLSSQTYHPCYRQKHKAKCHQTQRHKCQTDGTLKELCHLSVGYCCHISFGSDSWETAAVLKGQKSVVVRFVFIITKRGLNWNQGCQIWSQSGSNWPRIGQIKIFFFRSNFSIFWLGDLIKVHDLSHLGLIWPTLGPIWNPWSEFNVVTYNKSWLDCLNSKNVCFERGRFMTLD